MAKRRRANPVKNGDAALTQRVQVIADFREFENFREEILPALCAELLDKTTTTTAEGLLKKYSAYAAARGVSIALSEKRKDIALSAIKDILDRVNGKAIQRTDNHHSFDDLSDADLDAMVISKMEVAARVVKEAKALNAPKTKSSVAKTKK